MMDHDDRDDRDDRDDHDGEPAGSNQVWLS